jgi:SAM-dependent methyltransferase
MSKSTYVFAGTKHDAELERLRMLEAVFDAGTQRALRAGGLCSGSRCLEIGAGAGSIAAWMSETVGPTGRVAAVDINTRFLANLKGTNIDVHEADIRTVDLPPASFDLAHVRFVLIHVSDWRAALEATLKSLKPGGRLILEEPDFSASRALSGPRELPQAFEHVHRAIQAMFEERKMDYAFGARLPTIMQEHRLDDIAIENDAPAVPGGSCFAQMMGMSTYQLREKYLATNLATESDIERYGAFTAERSCWAIYHGTFRAIGTKPRSENVVY